jgi:hypothetical protein
MGDHVVVVAGVGLHHSPEDKVNRKWQDHRKGEVLTPEDLQYSDVDRLLELGAIRPVPAEDAAVADDEEDDEAPYEAWTVAQLKEEIGRRNDAKGDDEELLSTAGVKADLVAVLEADDEANEADASNVPGVGNVPEAAGPSIPESH